MYVSHNGLGPFRTIKEGHAGQILYDAFRKFIDQPQALVDASNGETISFKYLFDITCRLSEALKNSGYNRSSVISICSSNCPEFLITVIAALYQGIIIAPLNDDYTERELEHAITTSKPTLIFCTKISFPKLLNLRTSTCSFINKLILVDDKFESLELFIKGSSPANFNSCNFKPATFNGREQLAFVMMSSGTTGLPKAVMIRNSTVAIRFEHCSDRIAGSPFKPETTVLSVLPYFHAFGLFTTLGYLAMGLRVVTLYKYKHELLLKAIETYQVSSTVLVPPILVFLATNPIVDKYNLSSLKEIFSGSASLPREVEEMVSKRLNLKGIRQAYGLTETLTIFTVPYDQYKLGSCGKVVPFVTVKVVIPNTNTALGPNKLGEICVKTELLMMGYYGLSNGLSNLLDEDSWLRTGDVGYYDEDHFFYVTDRLKELIKCKGYQVPPAELEGLLLKHPCIKDAAVVGVPDLASGEKPVAFVVLHEGKKVSADAIKEFIKGQVSSAKRLHKVIFTNEIPVSSTGKIQRRMLRLLAPKL